MYDLYGKMGIAFEDSLIDAPVGKASIDYTSWLQANPDIAEEIDGLIKQNAVAQYGDLEWKDFDGTLTPYRVDDLYYVSDLVPPLSDPSVMSDGGAVEIDEEIIQCTKLSLGNMKVAKWIIETAALTNEEIVVISRRIKELVLTHFKDTATQRVFVKTSTGFYLTENNVPNGATLENIQLIVANAKPLQVKAAGGVRDYQMAKKMIALGVDRIGTSSSKEICRQEITTKKNNLY